MTSRLESTQAGQLMMFQNLETDLCPLGRNGSDSKLVYNSTSASDFLSVLLVRVWLCNQRCR